MMAKKPGSTNPEEDFSFADMLRKEWRLGGQMDAQAHAGCGRGKRAAAVRHSWAGNRKERGGADGRRVFNDGRQTKTTAGADQRAVDGSGYHKGCGCQNKRFQRLKRGKIKATASCDLHGCTEEQAERKLRSFFERLAPQNKECALIICGKGLHSPDKKPVIKSMAMAFMRSHENVLAYCPALQKDGGHGAFYVLIRR